MFAKFTVLDYLLLVSMFQLMVNTILGMFAMWLALNNIALYRENTFLRLQRDALEPGQHHLS